MAAAVCSRRLLRFGLSQPPAVPRRFRLLTALLSICALLLSTAAMAGYACPGNGKALEVAQMVEADMPCAESMSRAMDDQAPELCHAHCQSGQQSASTFQLPALATFEELGAVLSAPTRMEPAAPATSVMRSQLRRNTGPPLAVRNCCFRI